MKVFAGIGTRKPTQKQITLIRALGEILAEDKWITYSGNAIGTDFHFQDTAWRSVVYLPWKNHTNRDYDLARAHKVIVCGQSQEGIIAAKRLHPAPFSLNPAAIKMMARNYHIIKGHGVWPQADLVIALPTMRNGKPVGGTSHGMRVADEAGIKTINLSLVDSIDAVLKLIRS